MGTVRITTLVLFGFAACGGPADTTVIDAEVVIDGPIDAPVDAPVDAPDLPIDAPPPPLPPGAVISTSGGGVAASAGHRLHLRIGAPEPMGRATSAGHRITTGPGALPWANP